MGQPGQPVVGHEHLRTGMKKIGIDQLQCPPAEKYGPPELFIRRRLRIEGRRERRLTQEINAQPPCFGQIYVHRHIARELPGSFRTGVVCRAEMNKDLPNMPQRNLSTVDSKAVLKQCFCRFVFSPVSPFIERRNQSARDVVFFERFRQPDDDLSKSSAYRVMALRCYKNEFTETQILDRFQGKLQFLFRPR